MCLAALEDAMKKAGEVEKVYKEALLRCKCHAEVSYSAAHYYLEQVRERQFYLWNFWKGFLRSLNPIMMSFEWQKRG